AAGGGRVIRIDFFVAQRSPGIHGIDLFADSDGDRPGGHRISHSGWLDDGELPSPRSKTRASIARYRGVETATAVAFVQRGETTIAGGGHGRLWKRHF